MFYAWKATTNYRKLLSVRSGAHSIAKETVSGPTTSTIAKNIIDRCATDGFKSQLKYKLEFLDRNVWRTKTRMAIMLT